MNVWIDAQLHPALAAFLATSFAVHANHVQALGLIAATDSDIFRNADLFELLALHWRKIEALFQSGEQLVEIGGGS